MAKRGKNRGPKAFSNGQAPEVGPETEAPAPIPADDLPPAAAAADAPVPADHGDADDTAPADATLAAAADPVHGVREEEIGASGEPAEDVAADVPAAASAELAKGVLSDGQEAGPVSEGQQDPAAPGAGDTQWPLDAGVPTDAGPDSIPAPAAGLAGAGGADVDNGSAAPGDQAGILSAGSSAEVMVPEDVHEIAYCEADAFSDWYGCDGEKRQRLTQAFERVILEARASRTVADGKPLIASTETPAPAQPPAKLELAGLSAASSMNDAFWALHPAGSFHFQDDAEFERLHNNYSHWRQAAEFVLANREAPAESIAIDLALKKVGGSMQPSAREIKLWSVFRTVFLLIHDQIDAEEEAAAAAAVPPAAPAGKAWPGDLALTPQPSAFDPAGFSPRR
jgi:hypothetical protein